jgi:hypothetical protein
MDYLNAFPADLQPDPTRVSANNQQSVGCSLEINVIN